MLYHTLKRSGKNLYSVLRLKKRVKREYLPLLRRVSVGMAENLAHLLENTIHDAVLKSYNTGST